MLAFHECEDVGEIDATYDDQKQLYDANKGDFDAAAEFIATLKLTGTLPVPLAFFGMTVFQQHDKTRSEAFFTGLATGATGTDPHHPVLQFRNLLMKAHQSKQYRLTVPEVVAVMFKTWEAFVGGKSIKQLKCPTATELKKILTNVPLLYGKSASST